MYIRFLLFFVFALSLPALKLSGQHLEKYSTAPRFSPPKQAKASLNKVFNSFADIQSMVSLPKPNVGKRRLLNCKTDSAAIEALQAGLFAEADAAGECPEVTVWLDECTPLDAAYFTNYPYFAVWDTQNVNPYGVPLRSFTDTVTIDLFCEEADQHWSPPIYGTKVNSVFGPRWYRWHHGIDLGLSTGAPILAVFDGVVRVSKFNRRGYGNYVMVRHKNGLETLYAHLSASYVKPGDVVKAGDVIGAGGNTGRSTGPHLHFEVRYKGYAFNPNYLFDFLGENILHQEFTLSPAHFREQITIANATFHKIRTGDSLWTISKRYRTSINNICRLNGISKNTVLRPGRNLRIR